VFLGEEKLLQSRGSGCAGFQIRTVRSSGTSAPLPRLYFAISWPKWAVLGESSGKTSPIEIVDQAGEAVRGTAAPGCPCRYPASRTKGMDRYFWGIIHRESSSARWNVCASGGFRGSDRISRTENKRGSGGPFRHGGDFGDAPRPTRLPPDRGRGERRRRDGREIERGVGFFNRPMILRIGSGGASPLGRISSGVSVCSPTAEDLGARTRFHGAESDRGDSGERGLPTGPRPWAQGPCGSSARTRCLYCSGHAARPARRPT